MPQSLRTGVPERFGVSKIERFPPCRITSHYCRQRSRSWLAWRPRLRPNQRTIKIGALAWSTGLWTADLERPW